MSCWREAVKKTQRNKHQTTHKSPSNKKHHWYKLKHKQNICENTDWKVSLPTHPGNTAILQALRAVNVQHQSDVFTAKTKQKHTADIPWTLCYEWKHNPGGRLSRGASGARASRQVPGPYAAQPDRPTTPQRAVVLNQHQGSRWTSWPSSLPWSVGQQRRAVTQADN